MSIAKVRCGRCGGCLFRVDVGPLTGQVVNVPMPPDVFDGPCINPQDGSVFERHPTFRVEFEATVVHTPDGVDWQSQVSSETFEVTEWKPDEGEGLEEL